MEDRSFWVDGDKPEPVICDRDDCELGVIVNSEHVAYHFCSKATIFDEILNENV